MHLPEKGQYCPKAADFATSASFRLAIPVVEATDLSTILSRAAIPAIYRERTPSAPRLGRSGLPSFPG
ncbi:MAG: hypothetical protein MI919_08720 [Holophagales bacterium]|nr:hypothetical protein [Holophagales bacterium]